MTITAAVRSDPRVRRTRELITRAFGDLLQERGFAGVSVQGIGDRAGINRATFYAHFTDKYDLFDHVVRELFRGELEAGLPAPEKFSLDQLPQLVRVVLESLARVRSHCGPLGLTGAPPTEAIFQEEVQRFIGTWLGSRKGRGPRQACVDTTALVSSAGIIAAGLAWIRSDKPAELDHLVEEVCALLAPGLA